MLLLRFLASIYICVCCCCDSLTAQPIYLWSQMLLTAVYKDSGPMGRSVLIE